MKKRILSLALVFALCLGLAVPAFAASTFSDVPSTFWAYNEIKEAVNKGITSGYSDGTFKPGSTVTNAHFAAFLARAFYSGEYADGSASPWYKPYTDTLRSHGVLDGTTVGSNFSANINQAINRYDMAQMMYNVLKDKNVETPDWQELDTAKNSIGDWENIPTGYRTAVCNCYALGVLNGQGDGSFGGRNLMNRAQGCVVVSRLNQYLSNAQTKPDPNAHVLTNGKEITEENVMELIAELKEKYPGGTLYQPVGTRYYSDAIPTQSSHDGCNGWAATASDYIFGKYSNNKVYIQTDHTKIRAGDIIDIRSIETGENVHYSFAASSIKPGVGPGAGSFDGADASRGVNIVDWTTAELTKDFANNEYYAESAGFYWSVYTRYPDGVERNILENQKEINEIVAEHQREFEVQSGAKVDTSEIRCASCGYLMRAAGSTSVDTNSASGMFMSCDICHKWFLCGQCASEEALSRHMASCNG